MCDRNSRKASLLRCCIVRQKICCIVLLTTDSAAMSAPSKLLLMPRSVTVLNHVDQIRHCYYNCMIASTDEIHCPQSNYEGRGLHDGDS